MNLPLLRRMLAVFGCLAALPLGAAPAVTVAFGESLPPYVIPEGNRGIEVDVVREALALAGYTLHPRYVPQARLPHMLSASQVDATTLVNEDAKLAGHLSDVYVVYRDVAITLQSRRLSLMSIADLTRYSVAAFPKATVYLGEDYARMAAANPHYFEEPNQLSQNRLLYAGSVDVVVADIHIFEYLNHEAATYVDTRQPVTYHDLFRAIRYKVAFRDAALRDAFNRGLAELRRSGRYDTIVRGYQ